MLTFSIRRPAPATLTAAILVLASALTGCASTGSNDSPTAPVSVPATPATATVTPRPEVLATHPVVQIPESASATPAAPTAEDYDDLFDRIRAGYQLADVDDASIDQQLAWYANHPQYLERTLDRGQRYLYHIVKELEARKMPLELALLPVVESAFEPFGYSRASAAGLWQFIAPTGKRFGLKQNWWYDGRRDVLESTRAALDYLQFLHDEFNGDWLLAVAGYNCGEMNVRRAITANRAAGLPTDFWHLKLPKETRAYVPKLLAMRRLVGEPAQFGLEFSPIPNEPFFGTVETQGQIDLRMAAEIAGISGDELTYLNPAFNRWASDPDGPHRLLLPVDACEVFNENLSQIPSGERVRLVHHEVRKGETLSSIARKNGTSASVLKQINGLASTSAKLSTGQMVLLPSTGPALHPKVALAAARVDRNLGGTASRGRARGSFHVVRSGESLWSIARQNGVNVLTLAKMNGMKASDPLPAGRKLTIKGTAKGATVADADAGDGKRTTYTVRRGDTLFNIARRFSVSVSQLLSWNGLSKSHTLMPGQRLVMYVMGERAG